MAADEEKQKNGRIRPWSRPLLHTVLSAGVTFFLLRGILEEHTLGSFIDLLTKVSAGGVAAYLFFSLAALLLRAVRYRWMLAAGDARAPGLTIGRLVLFTAVRNALVDMMPARLGELSLVYLLRASGLPLTSGLTVFGLSLALDIIVLFGLFSGLAAAAWLLNQSLPWGIGGAKAAAAAAALLCLFLGAVLARLDGALGVCAAMCEALSSRLPGKNIRKRLLQAASGCSAAGEQLAVVKARGVYPRLVIITILMRAAKYTALYVLLAAVAAPLGVTMSALNPFLTTAAFVAAEASASLPSSGIMGFGAYEASWTVVLAAAGVEIPSPKTVAFAVHLITQIAGYSLGLLGLACLGWQALRRKNKVLAGAAYGVHDAAENL